MNVVQEFKINKNDSFKIVVPNIEDKYNYFYEPTEQLHVFDQVTVLLQQNDTSIEIAKDAMDTIVVDFEFTLEKIHSEKNNLPERCGVGDLGRIYNVGVNADSDDKFDITQCSVWSNPKSSTWIYRKNNQIYLEISPKYPWLYEDSEPSEEYITLQDFMSTYKLIALYEIDTKTIYQWLAQCGKIIENTATPLGYEYYKDNAGN